MPLFLFSNEKLGYSNTDSKLKEKKIGKLDTVETFDKAIILSSSRTEI